MNISKKEKEARLAQSKRDKQGMNKNANKNVKVVRTSAPAARNTTLVVGQPKMTQDGRTACVEHTELIVDQVVGSVAFDSATYEVNPGLALLPWLAKIANNYTKYKFEQLSFFFVPTKAATDTPGRVYLAWDYDGDAGGSLDFSLSKVNMLNNESLSSGSVWKDQRLMVDHKLAFEGVQWKRVRCGPIAGNQLMSDPGSLIVGSDGMVDTSVIGELWCQYKAKFKGAKSDVGLVPSPSNLFTTTQEANSTAMTSGTLYPIWQNTLGRTFLDDWNTLGAVRSAGIFTMLCGVYLFHMKVSYTTDAAEATSVRLGWTKDAIGQARDAYVSFVSTVNEYREIELTFIAEVPPEGADILMTVTFTGAAGNFLTIRDSTYLEITCL